VHIKTISAGAAICAIALSTATPSFAGRLGTYTSDQNGFDTHTFYYDDGKEVTLIDTQFVPELTQAMVEQVKKETQSPITRVIVTHPNPDKFNGLAYLHTLGVESIASQAAADAMPAVNAYKKYFFVNMAKMFTDTSYPKFENVKSTFSGKKVIQLKSGETLTLIELKNPGVTSDQVVVRIDKTGDLIVGDLVNHNSHAWLEGQIVDGKPKADLPKWEAALQELPPLSAGHPSGNGARSFRAVDESIRRSLSELRATLHDQIQRVWPGRYEAQGFVEGQLMRSLQEHADTHRGHDTSAVTLVGYGRYGNYIGPKYARAGFGWDIQAVIDPALTSAAFAETVLGRKRPDTRLFTAFEQWNLHYFSKLSVSEKACVVVELALPAARVLDAARQFIIAGVTQLILPKPVVDSPDDLEALCDLVSRYEVKAAVASQWFYSSIPKIIARDLRRLTSVPLGKRFDLDRVVIEFSKENGHDIAPAPLCELPHALQILESVGLLTHSRRQKVTGGPYSVVVEYDALLVRHGVFAVARMDYQPQPSQAEAYPDWDYQERTLTAYAPGGEPVLWVDFWIKFSPSGDSVIHTGRYSTREPDGQVHSHGIAEDLLQQMHVAIFRSFGSDYETFEKDENVLPLARYAGIGREIVEIHGTWKESTRSAAAA